MADPTARPFVVTDATNALGAGLVASLTADGCRVRLLHAPGNAPPVQPLVHPVAVDLRDIVGLEDALQGAAGAYHTASASALPGRGPEHLAALVEGTATVVNAALAVGLPRLVHTSSALAVGLNGDGEPADETQPYNLRPYRLPCLNAIHRAELETFRGEAEGLDVVVTLPGLLIDDDGGISGWLRHDLRRGALPGLPTGGAAMLSVADAVTGHRLAMAHGERGERYLLVGQNVRYDELIRRFAAELGVRPPTARLGSARIRWTRWRQAFVRHGSPLTSATVLTIANLTLYARPDRAQSVLGFTPTTVLP